MRVDNLTLATLEVNLIATHPQHTTCWKPLSHRDRFARRVLCGLVLVLGLIFSPMVAVAQRPPDAMRPSGRFFLSPEVQVDELNASTKNLLYRAQELIHDHRHEEAIAKIRAIIAVQGNRLIPVSPHRYVNVSDYCHSLIATMDPAGLRIYRQSVDVRAAGLYRLGMLQKDPANLFRILNESFCSSWGDDALISLGEMLLERGQHEQARACWKQLFRRPPSRIEKDVFDRARQLAPEPIATLLDKHYRPGERETKDRRVVPIYELDSRTSPEMTDAENQTLIVFWRNQRLFEFQLTFPNQPWILDAVAGVRLTRMEITPADIRARIIISFIMQNILDEADEAIESFERRYQGATGILGGRKVDLLKHLTLLRKQASSWKPAQRRSQWFTTSRDFSRNAQTSLPRRREIVLQAPLWRVPVQTAANREVGLPSGVQDRVAESCRTLLDIHPVISKNHLFFSGLYQASDDPSLRQLQRQVRAMRLHNGLPVWPRTAKDATGVIYDEPADRRVLANRGPIGVVRYTLTLHRNTLFVRMGSPWTTVPDRNESDRKTSRIVILDVGPKGQGRLLWDPLEPASPDWAFEGAPVTNGSRMFVAMRRGGIRPQSYVACYDLTSRDTKLATTNLPRLLWTTRVGSAETPEGGVFAERTQNLLTLHAGLVFFNSNMGAVAAIDSGTGRVRWLHQYRRASGGDFSTLADDAFFCRDMNPCVVHQGRLFVAPSDSDAIFSLDAATGKLHWSSDQWSAESPRGVVHLLGVASGRLIASGSRLWWMDEKTGRVLRKWPRQKKSGLQPFGKGIFVADEILWPQRDEILFFDQKSGNMTRPPFPLEQFSVHGGNLLVAGDILFVVNHKEIAAMRMISGAPVAEKSKK